MPSYDHLSPEQLYRQGLQQYNRADWQGAIASFTELQAASDQYPDVEDLLANARLKLQFSGSELPPALPPPRAVVRPILVIAALLLVTVGAAYGFYLWSTPRMVAEALPPTPAPAPTATTIPTAVPTSTPTAEPTDVPLIAGTVVVTAAEGETFVNTPANIEIIVDASGSMLAKFADSDRQRWEVAQEALAALVNSGTISDQSSVVVRTYGRRRGNDCNDLEVAQGLSRYNAEALLNVISGIKPAVGGMTPLASSLRAASEDLQAAEGSTVVILVTDGLESCNGDPVAEAANFVKDTDQRKVHVIGFAIGDQEASDKLRQIAEQGKGLYFDANDSAQLAEALRQTIVLSYQIVTAEGEQVAAGTVGAEPVALEPGTYTLKINANPAIEKELIVKSGGDVVVSLRQGFGGLVAEIQEKTR
ncbi:MAG TPA: vWA domain-containing protein [Herpetosiphonaceae bacterium]